MRIHWKQMPMQASRQTRAMTSGDHRVHAIVDYEDAYVQPLLLAALNARLPPELLVLTNSEASKNLLHQNSTAKLLQWRQYESIDFDGLMAHPNTRLANSYVIRKALIRKHYLSNTVAHWIAKHPGSQLKDHVKPAVDFEVDYAEFLDDALDQAEAWELRESWRRNAEIEKPSEKEWWILKPGMSDRGQGIRLFSSEEGLKAIFEEWDPPESDEEDEEEDQTNGTEPVDTNGTHSEAQDDQQSTNIMTSHLRHFITQPYIHPSLLLPPPHPSAGRKFHIRTYVVALGALKVYVYKRMLALFAASPYTPPGESSPNDHLPAHLTNTCLQTGEREGSVHEFWSLPTSVNDDPQWRENAFEQIRLITGEVFEAATRSMSVHFQPLPNAFELFGVDFMVDGGGTVWLLEVNAFPDLAQTGEELGGLVGGLLEGVVDVAVGPFFGVEGVSEGTSEGAADMVEVLSIDLGRR